jgi:hypothetical protein
MIQRPHPPYKKLNEDPQNDFYFYFLKLLNFKKNKTENWACSQNQTLGPPNLTLKKQTPNYPKLRK